jgi:hypothetical protein
MKGAIDSGDRDPRCLGVNGARGQGKGDFDANGGLITAARNFQPNTPDARFFQLTLKYIFSLERAMLGGMSHSAL